VNGSCDNGQTRPFTAFDEAWAQAATQVASKKLRGLMVTCPVCRRSGTAFSKWVKGACEKPLCVCHVNGKGVLRACQLNREQAARVKRRLSLYADDLLKLIRMGKPFALFSGGTDSLCLVARMQRLAETAKRRITAIHADTTAGLPGVEKYVRRVCAQLGVELVLVRPHRDFFETAKKWGIPSPRSRWCCETLKVAPMRRYLNSVDGPKIVFDGIRAAESRMRATYTPVWYHPAFKCLSVSPILYWSDEQIMRYIRRHKLPRSPAAKLGMSAECWCGAYQRRGDFEALLSIHPAIFERLVEVERAQRGKYTFVFENGEQVPLVEVRAQAINRGRFPESAAAQRADG
jgi:3'-phosphoadenosine 5'-phosphosulfate sulfotransferase (PAPS reductase)/FAD synthetase